MSWRAASLALAALTLVSVPFEIAAKKNETPVDPGPQPDFEVARGTTEAAIKASLFDPNSAEFQWPFAWTGGYWKPVLQGKKIGWWTCGLVNAKNRMGGYVGFQNFVVVFYNGTMVHYEVGSGNQFDFTNLGCSKALQQGVLKRVDSVAAQGPALDPTKPAIGLLFGPAPDGLYVTNVLPGYPATLAGIQPGMVISAVNGISLKGLPLNTAGQILSATGNEVTLTIIGRGEIKLVKALPSEASGK